MDGLVCFIFVDKTLENTVPCRTLTWLQGLYAYASVSWAHKNTLAYVQLWTTLKTARAPRSMCLVCIKMFRTCQNE